MHAHSSHRFTNSIPISIFQSSRRQRVLRAFIVCLDSDAERFDGNCGLMSTPEYQNTKNSLTFSYQLNIGSCSAEGGGGVGAWGNKQFALATIEETLRDEPSRMKFKSRKKAGRRKVRRERGGRGVRGRQGVDSTMRGVLMGLLFQRTSD